MVWEEIDFIIRETGLQLRRERLIAIATISTVAVLLLVLGSLVLFYLNLRLWTGRVANEVEIRAYFGKEVSRADAQEVVKGIGAWSEVRSVRFVPKEEALQWLRERLASSSALRGIGNPLPDAVRVQVRGPDLVPRVAKRLASVKGIKDVVQSAGFVRWVVKARRIISWSGAIISGLVAIAGMFIIHNTIRLALHARWREIYIMQLVGAARLLVAAPFLLEGMIHGLLGAAIACCLLIPAHMYLRALSARAAPFLLLLPDRALLTFGLGLLLAGALLGFTGSLVSLRRFLTRRPEWHN